MSSIPADKFRFRRHATIGAEAAEEDQQFLAACFVDTGDLQTLQDCRDPKRIILGRTGTGKTALLTKFASEFDSILIRPESLSFNYLANSMILQFFLDAGVKLDIFFKLLWRHVFTVELLKKRYHITNEAARKTFLDRFKAVLTRDKKKERAIAYLLKWGERFWEPTEYRIKEITGTIEQELKGSVASRIPVGKIEASAGAKLSREDRIDVVQRGQAIINDIQIRELTDVLEFLDEDVFADQQSHFYLLIDKLDENWIDDRFRYLLIRSLVETVRDFLKVRNVKIIIAVRSDLLERVFRFTRDPGFQEEKYRSLFLPLRWNDEQLKELLDRRIDHLVRQSYTKSKVGYKDLLPQQVDGDASVAYMIHRTLMRPRELIEFFNECVQRSEGRPTVSKASLLEAEGIYSKNRLRSLQDEWVADYPTLADFAFILRKKHRRFGIGELTDEEIAAFCLAYAIDHESLSDALSVQARGVAEDSVPLAGFRQFLFHVFYKTGIVGLKVESHETLRWSHVEPASIAADSIDDKTRVEIHPSFWRVLETRLRS